MRWRVSFGAGRPGPILGALVALGILVGDLAVARGAAPDRCQEDPACKEETQKAAQFAAQTRYVQALALYQSAYDRVHEPRLLVNLGRCHFRLGRARKALELYAAFQKAEPSPDPQLAARLQQFIGEAKQAVDSDTSGPQGGAAVDPLPGLPRLLVPPSPPVDEPPPAEPPATGANRLVLGRPLYRVALGASMLGLGVVSLGLGVGALAANGQCVMPSVAGMGQCALVVHTDGTSMTRVLDGVTPGVPLLLIGLGLSAGGIALIAVPPRRPTARTTSPK